jgi:hypothetical protein
LASASESIGVRFEIEWSWCATTISYKLLISGPPWPVFSTGKNLCGQNKIKFWAPL